MALPVRTNSYLTELHQTLMTYYNQVIDNDFLLENDDEGYEKLLRDASLAGLIRQMKHLTVGQHWAVIAGDDFSKDVVPYISELASFVTEDEIQKSLFFLTDSVIKGLAICKVEMQRKWVRIGKDTKPDWWWVPVRLIPIDKRRILRTRDDNADSNKKWGWAIYNIEKNEWEEITDITPYLFHFYDVDELHPYGRGLGGSLFYYWHAKAILYEMMLQGAEIWAGGWLVAYIDGLKRSTGDAFKDRATRQEVIDQLETMKSNKIFAMAKDDQLQVLNGPSQGHGIIMESLKYLDDAMAILLLSSNLVNINSGGSFAMARVKSDEQQAGGIQYNKISLAGAMSKYFVKNNLWRKNMPNLRARGFGFQKAPSFVLDQRKVYDPESQLRIAQQMKGLGVPIYLNEIYERAGFTQPPEDEPKQNILGVQDQQQSGLNNPFGFSRKAQFAKQVKDANDDFDDLTKHTARPVADMFDKFFRSSSETEAL